MPKKITNIGSGIYFNEIDLTVVQQSAGTFAGAAIGLMEKGPAFEAMGFASFEDRALRMGDLNPKFKSSYYAKEFLTQASNYKEVRILGLEGYNEDLDLVDDVNVGGLGKAFVVMYDDGLGKVSSASPILRINNIVLQGTDVAITVDDASSLVNGRTVNVQDVEGITQVIGNTNIALSGRYFISNLSNNTFILQTYVENSGLANIAGAGTYVPGTGIISSSSPVKARSEMIAAVLKPRRSTDPAFPIIDYVVVNKGPQIDGTTEATDEMFTIMIYYKGNQNTYAPLGPIKCSLRESSSNYIATVFGRDPKDNTKVLGLNSPLWVEYVYPSVKAKCDITGQLGYYYPGGRLNLGAVESGHVDYDPQSETPGTLPTPLSVLNLAEGNMTVTKSFTYEELGVTDVQVNGAVTITTSLAHGFINGEGVTLSNIVFASGQTELQPIDGNWIVKNTASTTFDIVDANGENPANVTGVYSRKANSFARKSFTTTWESEIMDLGGKGSEIEYQTPVTPWFVTDFDDNGITKRLFRVWSISDGESANTEIKIEIANINPDGNNGLGSFDLRVRNFNDTEDKGIQIYESYANLTLDPKSTNYILRRIGDGDQFPLQSSFIFIELNEGDVIAKKALPYGCEGYPNTYGLSTPDMVYATQYDLSNSISKQSLGLSNNRINTRKAVALDNLSFKNISSSTSVGKGFHLNPKCITASSDASLNKGATKDVAVYQMVEKDFFLVDHRSYNTSTSVSTKVSGLQKVARSKFVVAMFGGFDAWNVYADRNWEDITSNDRKALDKAIEVLADYESLRSDFSVLVTPDIDFQNNPSATGAVLEMVENRGDALYLFDFDYGYTTGLRPEINPTDAKIALEGSRMKSSFAACHYPDAQIVDERNSINVWLPASIVSLATIASVATNENVWQPPAGSLRTVTTNLVRTRKRMKANDREILKSANINPITEFAGSGFEITESRTTQPVFSSLSFIHNRLLLGYAKKALNQVLRPLLHQLKNDNLRDAFLNAVRPIFARIKRLNGLAEFEVIVKGLDEDRTTLHGRIIITPLYPVERIVVDFVLKDGAIDYNAQ